MRMQPSYTPTATRARRGNRWIIPGAILAFVVVFAAIFAIHTFSAANTVKTFNDDYFSYKFDAAFNLLCPDKQAKLQASFDAAKTLLNATRGHITFDTSQLTYDLTNLGLTTATVHEHGAFRYSGDIPSASINVDDTVSLAANGLGWCLNILPDNTK
jgi:hypothetical protein